MNLLGSSGRRRRRGRGEPGLGYALAKGAGALLFGLVVALGVAEGVARLAVPHWREFESSRLTAAPAVDGAAAEARAAAPGFDGWIAHPGGEYRTHVVTDPLGLRNDGPAATADGRLWVVGGSVAFGWGVETAESVGAVAAAGLGWQLFSVASPDPAAGPESWRALLARLPAGVTPRGVLLALDLDGLLRARAGTPPASGVDTLTTALVRRSALSTLVSVAVRRAGGLNDRLVALGLATPVDPSRAPLDEAGQEALLAATARAVEGLRDSLPAGVPFAALLVPPRRDLDGADPEARALRLGLADRLARAGIATIDPFATLAAEGAGRAYFLRDRHWSPLGHRLAGELAARALAAQPPAPAPAAGSPAAPAPAAPEAR